jgi:hypothetical protein
MISPFILIMFQDMMTPDVYLNGENKYPYFDTLHYIYNLA